MKNWKSGNTLFTCGPSITSRAFTSESCVQQRSVQALALVQTLASWALIFVLNLDNTNI